MLCCRAVTDEEGHALEDKTNQVRGYVFSGVRSSSHAPRVNDTLPRDLSRVCTNSRGRYSMDNRQAGIR